MSSGHYQRTRRTSTAYGVAQPAHDTDTIPTSTSPMKRRRQEQSARRTRQLALVLIFGISFGIFHMLWLHTQLMDYEQQQQHTNVETTTASQLPLRYWKTKDALLKQEIYHTLDCHKILSSSRQQPQQASFAITTARHLYCQVAAPDNQSFVNNLNRRFFASFSKRKVDSWMIPTAEQHDVLLAIYQFAKRTFAQAVAGSSLHHNIINSNRKHLLDANDWLRNVLHQAVPLRTTLLGHPVELWAPARDQGLVQALEEIHERYSDVDNNGNSNNYLSLNRWADFNNAKEKFMVQVGSHLGVSVLAVLQRCRQCRILSLEAAAPNVLLQLLNLARNNVNSNHQEALVTVMAVALGEEDKPESKVMHFAWQPYATASCKSWPSGDDTASASLLPSSFQFTAMANSLDAVLQQYSSEQTAAQEPPQFTMNFAAGKTTTNEGKSKLIKKDSGDIDLLVMDCQGCEYNVIPHFAQTLEASKSEVRQMVGTIHWGSIPHQAKPSSARAQATHRVLCRYSDFTQRFKECCEYRNFENKNKDDLCHDFQSWATDQFLWDVPEDTQGWKQELPLDALGSGGGGGGGTYSYDADFWRKGQEVEDEELTEEEIRLIGGDDIL